MSVSTNEKSRCQGLSYDVFSQDSRAEGQAALDAVCIVGRSDRALMPALTE